MSTKTALIALAAGAALGAISGILLAPASGKDTRKKIMKKGEELRDQLADLVDQGKDLVDEAKGQAKSAAAQASSKAQEAADKAKSAYSNGKTAAQKA